MVIAIKVRLSIGSYQARALGRGVRASSAQSAVAAARSVCTKLGADPELLTQTHIETALTTFTPAESDASS